MVIMYITCKDRKEARQISMHLLKKRAIACSNIFPVESMYRWNYKIVDEPEYIIMAKTNNKNFKKAVDEVKKVHSYKIPCILRIEAKANKEYESWVNKEVK